MIVIKMPGGDVEYVEAKDLLWFRQAFDHEFTGAVMLRLSADRIYSSETVADLKAKFAAGGAALAAFTTPDFGMDMIVNAERVREVEPPNPAIYPESAGSVLKFGTKLKLAVRESQPDARQRLAAAHAPDAPTTSAAIAAGAVGGAVLGAALGVVAAVATSGPDPDGPSPTPPG